MHYNDLLLQECIYIVQEKVYTVKPISFYYIRKKEFDIDRIYVANEDESRTLISNLISKNGRKKINKWLRRLVTYNGEPLTLGIMRNHKWTKEDITGLFDVILEISGLKPKDENSKEQTDEDKSDKDEYLNLFSILLMDRTMTRDEILNSSLPYLISIAGEIQEQRMLSSGLGMFGGLSTTKSNDEILPEISTNNMEEFANSINNFYK